MSETTMDRYTLRDATEADAEYLYALDVATMREYVVATYGEWDEAHVRRRIVERISLGMKIVVVDERAVGLLEVYEVDGDLLLQNIRVGPESQRKGLGTAIIRDVIAAAHAEGKGVSLRALSTNPAIGLYRRLGFEVTRVDEWHTYMRCSPG